MSLAAAAERLGQAAHLAGHHRKAAALLTGAGRLDRRIERRNTGLKSDRVDQPDDVADLATRCRDLLQQRRLPPPHHPAALLGHLRMTGAANRSASCDEEAVCCTLAVSCDKDDTASWAWLAVCSVRWDKSWLPLAISWLALAMFPLASRTCATKDPKPCCISAKSAPASRPPRPCPVPRWIPKDHPQQSPALSCGRPPRGGESSSCS